MIKRIYGDLASVVRLTNFSRAMWTDEAQPHGQPWCVSTHAAENRHVFKIVAQLCRKLNSGSLRDVHRLCAALCLCHVCDIFGASTYFLTCGVAHCGSAKVAML